MKKLSYRLSFALSVALIGSLTSFAGEKKPPVKPAEMQSFSNWRNKPHEPFVKGAENFEKVKNELLKNYYDKNLTEDDLYRAATQGMLNQIDPTMSAWNTLYSPAEFQELSTDMGGEVVGVGIQTGYNDVTGYSFVAGTVPGSPAEKAGIKMGDQILKVDNKSFRNKELRDLVYAIRGKAGTEVKLSLFHDETIKEITLKRERLVIETNRLTALGDGIGHLAIDSFTEKSAASIRKILASLKDKGIKSLIVDLRSNDGGLFDSSIDCIKLFIPKGKTIVKMTKRGPVTEDLLATEEPVVKKLPMVVLISSGTKSAGEIMAAALKMSAGATLVGTHSFGKWSAQRLDELPNKFALKYTIATFLPPEGPDLTGKGLTPDINVEMEDGLLHKVMNRDDIKAWLASDIQLQAAVNLLKMKK